MSDWFEAQIRYYQRCLIEGRDPSELHDALSARRDSCLARLWDAVEELHDVHGVAAEEIARFVRLVLAAPDSVDA